MPSISSKQLFCPPVRQWFDDSFEKPTTVQSEAWSAISESENVLVAAPTGSGKTLAAFLCAINELVEQSQKAPLPEQVAVLYISPLKALSNDIQRNLERPLAGIEKNLLEAHLPASGIRAMVRTGDTPPSERQKMVRRPPQILVTTPESLYLLLTSDSGRSMLSGVRSVIVDEIHALAGSKRGSHLALSLARLDALCVEPPRRIGLSATQKPIEQMANYLTGGRQCTIVDTGHQRERDIQLELTGSPLSAVMANEVWVELYDRLEHLVTEHETTLIFVNTRRLAERIARHLAERLGEDSVTAHHGSLSRKHRLEAEQALKAGKLRALVATASLELGIDIGHVNLVCQMGSPGGMSTFLQRVGRSGHTVGGLPRGRLFPLSRDDLVECVAMLQAIARDELDAIHIPVAPLDVLSQQIVAELSAREWKTDELFHQVRQAWPYRDLEMDQFESVVVMLSEGYSTRRGRRSAWIFNDAVNRRLKARPAARLTALQNGGAIPDHFDYDVVMLPQGHRIGSLTEDFAFESMPGDIFQLGNTSYRVLKVEQGRVLVEDAAGQSPTIPFWVGDRPGRSDELSIAVSELRQALQAEFEQSGPEAAIATLQSQGVSPLAASQLVEYLHAAWQALGCLPTRDQIVLERFFDDSGDMHLVLHAPLGSSIMSAWGLSLRKRFCRRFNFELQASALEDSLILSLGETHSFELADVPGYLHSASVEQVLVQALLDAPMFEARWRWNATIALAVQRMRNGQKLPPQWQRNQAEDLVSVVFPDQIACLENIAGAREIPEHPLVDQTIDDCLRDTMDVDGLIAYLKLLEDDRIKVHCADLTGPSPLSREVISARPYAFLDDGEAENRRTRAISHEPDDLGRAQTLRIISVEATRQVSSEAWIRPRDPDELHDGLLQLGFLTEEEYTTGTSCTGAHCTARRWGAWFELLVSEHRACCATTLDGKRYWLAAERINEWMVLHPESRLSPTITSPVQEMPADRESSLVQLLRDRMAGLGPATSSVLQSSFNVSSEEIEAALLTLQSQGYVIRMENEQATWCERRLLARIHRYSRERRRKSVKPAAPRVFERFLAQWHGLGDQEAGLQQALSLLQGWSAPISTWEQSLLTVRCSDYDSIELDQYFLSGELAWFRPRNTQATGRQVISASPIAIIPRHDLVHWRGLGDSTDKADSPPGSAYADKVRRVLKGQGAVFTSDLEQATGLLRPQLEEGLKALVYSGDVTADAFSPLRWLLRPEQSKARAEKRSRGKVLPMGRWSLLDDAQKVPGDTERLFSDQQALATICKALLSRYGVVFRAVLVKESGLPPWRMLLRYFRRMEDRGEVRGGRFVDGFSGEQFALPEAIGLLKQCAQAPDNPSLAVISASDPLNLGGVLSPGPKTPAQAGNRVLLEDGHPVARLVAGEYEELKGISRVASQRGHDLLRVVTPWRRKLR